MPLSVDEIKAAVASYYRYTRQCPLVALEANCQLQPFSDGGQADILVVDRRGLLVEIEVKISMGDFRRDKHKRKHNIFRHLDKPRFPRLNYTSYFYFAVPKSLANEVAIECDQLYPYAGVWGLSGPREYDLASYRNARVLPAQKLGWEKMVRMAKEQSATICRLATKLAEINKKRINED